MFDGISFLQYRNQHNGTINIKTKELNLRNLLQAGNFLPDGPCSMSQARYSPKKNGNTVHISTSQLKVTKITPLKVNAG